MTLEAVAVKFYEALRILGKAPAAQNIAALITFTDEAVEQKWETPVVEGAKYLLAVR